MIRFYFLLIGTIMLFVSCATMNQEGEPAATEDATPPPGYNPVFITHVRDYDVQTDTKPAVDISEIDVRQPNIVKVKFSVVDNNDTHLKGISAANFKKFWCEIVDSINGKELIIKKPKIYEVHDKDVSNLSFSVVMDESGSMGEDRARAVQNAVNQFISAKENDENISVTKYDDKVVTECPMTNSKTELLKNFKMNGLEGFGNLTATSDGIQAGIEALKTLPKNYQKNVLVFTDGWDNSSKFNKDTIIKMARMDNISICAVDFGENINPDYMKYFADSTSGIYKHIYRTNEFKDLFTDLYNRLKNYYVIEFRPNEFGDHKFYFKMCFPNDTIMAKASFNNIPDIGAMGSLAINFDFNKATIKKESEEDIEYLFALLKAFPVMEIELRGHTDSLNKTGDTDYNTKLSQKRADAVKDALVKKGINGGRITTKGLGDSEPIASNETEEGRAENRRTEFLILKK